VASRHRSQLIGEVPWLASENFVGGARVGAQVVAVADVVAVGLAAMSDHVEAVVRGATPGPNGPSAR